MVDTDMKDDPHHPIIKSPWEYVIGSLLYHVGLDGTEPYIDLVLQRDGHVRRLRFFSPQQLEIEDGFPRPTHGMVILDVSARRLDRLSVWVTDVEGSWGKIGFWARAVVDLDVRGNSD